MWNAITRLSAVYQVALAVLAITTLVLGLLTTFVAMRTSSAFIDKKQLELGREVNLVANNLAFFYANLTTQTDRLGEIFFGMFPDGLTLDETRTARVGEYDAPVLLDAGGVVNLDFTKPDRFTQMTGGTATVFVRHGDDFLRVSTSLRKQDGSRAFGTLLGKGHPGYATLMAGQTYAGPAFLFGRHYMTKYIPVKGAGGKVIAVLYVGFDYSDQMAALKRSIGAIRVGETGYIYAMAAAPGKSYGRLVLHPKLEGEDLLAMTTAGGERVFEKLLAAPEGTLRYPWPDPARSDAEHEKLVAFKHVDGWDWVVAAGSFTDEFIQESLALRNALVFWSVVSGLVMAALVFLALRWQLQPLTAIRRGMDALGRGDLTARVRVHGMDDPHTHNEIQLLARDINQMGERLRDLVGRITDSADALGTSAKRLAAVSHQTGEGVRRQQGDTDLVAAAVNEMAATVQEVARSAATAAERTREADERASEGGAVVREVVSAIDALAREVEHSAEVIGRVEHESDSISTVVEVITSIAEQTNLLALNAAIEAARAGDQGRGFAVVADEVRVLAQKTRQSTTEIKEMIERLQASTKAAVKGMQSGREQAQRTVDEAGRAGETLAQITRSVSAITDMTTQIATAAEQQTQVAEDINRRVVSIRDVASANAGATDEMASAMEELAGVAGRLNSAVGTFKI